MKIKLDENLPVLVAESLEGLGHDVHTTLREGLKGRADAVIWEAAQVESRFLITPGSGFFRYPRICSRNSLRHPPSSYARAQPSEPNRNNREYFSN